MRPAGIGQVVNRVHLRRGQGYRRRREPDIPAAVFLHQRTGVAGIALPVQHTRRPRIGLRIGANLLIGGQAHDYFFAADPRAFVAFQIVGEGFDEIFRRRVTDEGEPANVGKILLDPLFGDAMRDLDQGAFGVAIEQKVGLGVEQDGAADLVGPIIVMGDAPQRRLDAANDDGRIRKSFPTTLGIDNDGAIRSSAAFSAGSVGIVMAQPAVRRVAVDHGVHVAGGHAIEKVWLAKPAEILRVLPVRLGDEPDAESLRLEQAANDRHAETGVVYIGVAGDEDDVAGIPAKRLHLLPRHGQEWRDAETMRPMLAVGKQLFLCLRWDHRALSRMSGNGASSGVRPKGVLLKTAVSLAEEGLIISLRA